MDNHGIPFILVYFEKEIICFQQFYTKLMKILLERIIKIDKQRHKAQIYLSRTVVCKWRDSVDLLQSLKDWQYSGKVHRM